jgi:transcriptional activator of cad operon
VDGDFRIGDWLIRPQLNRLEGSDGKATSVEPKAMEVLIYLAQHSREVLLKENIIQAVWQDTFVTDDVLAHAISELRKAFGDSAKNSQIIMTIPRRGYRLLPAVSFETSSKTALSHRSAWKRMSDRC